MINEGLGNKELFPVLGNFDTYIKYMSVFGWNGKTKEECLANLYISAFVFYCMCLLSILYSVYCQSTGRRILHTPDQNIKVL